MADSDQERIEQLERRLQKIELILWKQFGVAAEKPEAYEKRKEKVATLEPTPQQAQQTTPEFQKAPSMTSNKTITAPDFEQLIGGRGLSIVGIIVFVLGIAFFVGYAFQQNWIGPTGRVIIGYLTGITLLGLGEYLSKKYKTYSWGLTAGALTAFYISTYAAFSLYLIIDKTPALILMILITATAVLLALRYDSKTIAEIGLLGGFLTPFVISGSGPVSISDTVGLFAYFGILNLGIVALAFFRQWKIVTASAFIISIISYLAWSSEANFKLLLYPALIYLTFFFALYLTALVAMKLKEEDKFDLFDIVLLLINPLFFFVTSLWLFDWDRFYGAALALMLALIYGSVAYFVSMDKGKKIAATALYGIALTSATLALPFIFELRLLTIAFSVEAVVLVFAGLTNKNKYLLFTGFILLVFSGLRAIGFNSINQVDSGLRLNTITTPFFNKTAGIFIIVIACFYLSAWLVNKYENNIEQSEAVFAKSFTIIGANFLTLFWLSLENSEFFKGVGSKSGFLPMSVASLSVLWGLYSAVLIGVGIAFKSALLRYMGLALLFITVIKLFLVDLSGLDAIYRVISFVGLGIILLLLSFVYQKFKEYLI